MTGNVACYGNQGKNVTRYGKQDWSVACYGNQGKNVTLYGKQGKNVKRYGIHDRKRSMLW